MVNELERLAASLLIAGFPGESLTDELRSLLSRGLGGVILFKRNISSPVQVAALNAELQGARSGALPLVVSVDQEGGKVARLREPLTVFPELANLGSTGDEGKATTYGEILAYELTRLGFNLDYAPVMDVDSNPANPIIGRRSFGADPHLVARMGAAAIHGMQRNGLMACAKHFPGHGDTTTDSHLELPELPHSLERLESLELIPFQAAVEAGVATIMTAHVLFRGLDPELPATLSPVIIDTLLRTRLGYDGVVISDDLEMKAVLDHYGVARSVELGLLAGVDAFLVCHEAARQEEALEALVKTAERDSVGRYRLTEAARRVEQLRQKLEPERALPPAEVERHMGLAAHREFARALANLGQLV